MECVFIYRDNYPPRIEKEFMKKKTKCLFLLIILFSVSGCKAKTVDSIAVNLENNVFDIDDFDISSIKLSILYSNDEIDEINLTEKMLSDEDNQKLKIQGTHLITVNYEEKVTSFVLTLSKVLEVDFIEGTKVLVEKGDPVSLPITPVKDGYVFDGWYTDIELNNKYDFNTPVMNNLTLYPKWSLPIAIISGLEITYNGSGYSVTGYSGDATAIAIPETYNDGYNGLAVVSEIGARAFKDNDSIVSVVLPSTITIIREFAFAYCPKLININIPDNVFLIDNYSFYECPLLVSTKLPTSLITIGTGAFGGCESLTTITIPQKTSSIRGYAFTGCTSLNSITISDGVKTIGEEAFRGCTSLTNIFIPDNVTSLGYGAFQDCYSLTSITMSNSLTAIQSWTFSGTPLVNLTIPTSIKTIDYFAFYGCDKLASITIPNGVTTINYNAFYGCTSLTSIYIPSSVTVLEGYAFENCPLLTIYCSVSEKPSGWSDDFNIKNSSKESILVIWNYNQ